jgi:LmbE family N-acetylglucosaminyl deacetylase
VAGIAPQYTVPLAKAAREQLRVSAYASKLGMAQHRDPLAPLLSRTLVLAPHPDDEAAGCGILLQRMQSPLVAFLTDGAPRDPYFWQQCGSREAYAELRRREAHAACQLVGAATRFCEGITDQELFRNLEDAQSWLDRVVAELHPNALLVPAFEGGHPDHDSANLLGALAAKRAGVAVWEFPLYHRSVDGNMVRQAFRVPDGETRIEPTPAEWEKKLRMMGEHTSQREVLQHFLLETEAFRPLAKYDYSAPPHPGVLNYEAWQWGITGSEVAAAFSAHIAAVAAERTTAGASTYSE